MTRAIDITAERVHPSGAWRLTTIHEGRYISELFMGYTKRQAFTMFRQNVIEGKS